MDRQGEHAAGNIAFVLHEGDIVDDDVAAQWTRAYNSLHMLDGVVPYVLVGGQPRLLRRRLAQRTAQHDDQQLLPGVDLPAEPVVQGDVRAGPDREQRTRCSIVPGGAGQWLVIALEFGPRDTVLAWADGIVKRYADTPAMVVTHAYLYDDDHRYDRVAHPDQRWNPHNYPIGDDHRTPGAANDGEEIWQKLVLGNSNIRFVLSGHVLNTGVGRLTSTRADGTVVHQILANYQNYNNGGDGYLRLLRFFPAQRTVHVRPTRPRRLHEGRGQRLHA